MDKINTDHLQRCIDTLAKSFVFLGRTEEDTIEYEMYRNSLVKGFEITLEQSGKLLRKKITPYFASKKEVDRLVFKDIFRHASKCELIDDDEVMRWLEYRDNRNNTAHDYGVEFAEITLKLAETLIEDAQKLKDLIDNG